jgi:signal transduction histidine kinase
MNRVRLPNFLDVATYVSMAAMSLLGISGLPSLRSKLLALALVLVFGCLYHFVFRTERYRQNPNLYFGAQTVILCLLFLLRSDNQDAFNFLFLILTIHIAVVSTARVAILWIALGFGMLSLLILATVGADGLYAILFYSVTFVVCGFFGSTIQQVERARDRNQQLLDELQEAQQRLRELAVLEERNRLARELHDSVKQQVFAVSMQLGAARALLQEENPAYAPVVEAERLARQAGAELTTLIRELRPPDLESKPLTTALQDYVTEWSRQNQIHTDLHLGDSLTLSMNVEQTLFRVVQEALANVARHSHATKVKVELIDEDPELLLCIADNGEGFDMERGQRGVGLQSMHERLAQIGGSLHVSSEKHTGTQITARLRRA